jgi:hypothetical protein
VRLRTPTPAALLEALWEAKTPSNVRELEAQSILIRDRIQWHKSSSPAWIILAIGQLEKGPGMMYLSTEPMRARITSLERANEAATKRKQRKEAETEAQALNKGRGRRYIGSKGV